MLYVFTSYSRKVAKYFGIVIMPSLKKAPESMFGFPRRNKHTLNTHLHFHMSARARAHTQTHSHTRLSTNGVHWAVVYCRSYFCVSRSTFLLLIKMSRW